MKIKKYTITVVNKCAGSKEEFIYSTSCFDQNYSGTSLIKIPIQGRYVSDAMPNMDCIYTPYGIRRIVLKAPTGKGKNYWINYVVRPFARDKNLKTLYLCNRVALDKQMKLESAMAVDPLEYSKISEETDVIKTGSMTCITYHKFLSEVHQGNTFEGFKIIICDEAHFFASDAFFNPNTLEILESIAQIFSGEGILKIYMSATPENAIDLIYSVEFAHKLSSDEYFIRTLEDHSWPMPARPQVHKGNLITHKITDYGSWPAYKKANEDMRKFYMSCLDYDSSSDRYPLKYEQQSFEGSSNELGSLVRKCPSQIDFTIYEMDPDYSCYKDIYVFDKNETIIQAIDKSDEKWIIFVTSKSTGKSFEESLKKLGKKAIFLSSETRKSADFDERTAWNRILETGKTDPYDVIITTSVLDNGFSIKDKDVAHIVLFTDDRTEFLQELGRIRLFENQSVKIYFTPISTRSGRLHDYSYKEKLNVFAHWYGSNEIWEFSKIYPASEIPAAFGDAVDVNHVPGFVGSFRRKIGDSYYATSYYINDAARWELRNIKEEIDAYTVLSTQYGDITPILLKARWLSENPEELMPDNLNFSNLEIPDNHRSAEAIDKCLEPFLNIPLAVSSITYGEAKNLDSLKLPQDELSYVRLALSIGEIFKKYLPDQKNKINDGANRSLIGKAALGNRIDDINARYGEFVQYVTEPTESDCFILKKKQITDSNNKTSFEVE